MSCGCGCGGHGGCGDDARTYAPRRRRPYYTGRLRRRGYEPEYMAAPAPTFGARMSFAAGFASAAAKLMRAPNVGAGAAMYSGS